MGPASSGRATGNVNASTPGACATGTGPSSRFPPPPPPPLRSTRGGATNTIRGGRGAGRASTVSLCDRADRGAGSKTRKAPIEACTRIAVAIRLGVDSETRGMRGDGRSSASRTRSREASPGIHRLGAIAMPRGSGGTGGFERQMVLWSRGPGEKSPTVKEKFARVAHPARDFLVPIVPKAAADVSACALLRIPSIFSMTRVRWFDDIGMVDLPVVGGKNASLGEMRRALTPLGIRTPDGFATTADAYRAFLRAADLERVIRRRSGGISTSSDIDALQAAGARVRVRHSGRAAARRPHRRPFADAYRRLEAAVRRQLRRRRAQQRHGRGSARRELRRPAGDLSQHPRRGDAARRRQALLRLALHRSRDRLPGASRLRPHAGGAVGRRAEDGAVRSRQRGRDVLDRYRDRVLQRRPDHRRLRAWRERRAGHGQSGRVLRVQADAATRTSGRSSRRSSARRSSSWSTRKAARGRRAACRCPPTIASASCCRTTTC